MASVIYWSVLGSAPAGHEYYLRVFWEKGVRDTPGALWLEVLWRNTPDRPYQPLPPGRSTYGFYGPYRDVAAGIRAGRRQMRRHTAEEHVVWQHPTSTPAAGLTGIRRPKIMP